MLTRTLPSPDAATTVTENTESPEFIEQQVDERGFYLYEWISPDELRITLERDYLQIVRWSSIPLAVITAIAGFVGFAGGPIGTILAALGVLGVFYFFVALFLTIKFMYYSYLYVRGANVIITDNHYVSGGNIIVHTDKDTIQKIFSRYESVFDESFMGVSRLAEKKKIAKTALFDNLKDIAGGGGKLLQKVGRSRDSGGLVIIILITGFLYAAMMGLVYFIGIFFISLFGRIFAWLAHRYLLAVNNTEHEIQTRFTQITRASIALKSGQKQSVSLLTDAGRGEWVDSLSSRLRDSFAVISEMANEATNQTVELRTLLENSKYKDIFNFVKYGNWIQGQVISPIEEIIILLTKNHDTIMSTITTLNTQIQETTDPSLQKPLILQRDRLEMQIESIAPMIEMLEGYRTKLNTQK